MAPISNAYSIKLYLFLVGLFEYFESPFFNYLNNSFPYTHFYRLVLEIPTLLCTSCLKYRCRYPSWAESQHPVMLCVLIDSVLSSTGSKACMDLIEQEKTLASIKGEKKEKGLIISVSLRLTFLNPKGLKTFLFRKAYCCD